MNEAPPVSLPGFTIVVPTHDRPTRLSQCLRALSALDYPRDKLQIVVVDDGSPNSLREVVDREGHGLDIELIVQENAGPASARNIGVERARHPYVAFTDDDCAPDPRWLLELAVALAETPTALIGGRTVNALPKNLYAEASQELVSYLYEYYNTDDEARFFTSNNMALPIEGFRAVGGFSASFPLAAAEDRDLCRRWFEAGSPMSYAPRALVDHFHELKLRSFTTQHFGYGRGAHGYHQRRAERGEARVRLEPMRFYTGLLSYPMRRHSPAKAFGIAVLMFVSQAANASGYFFEKARASKRKTS